MNIKIFHWMDRGLICAHIVLQFTKVEDLYHYIA